MMQLIDHACSVDFQGRPQPVIEDAPLLEWARANGVSPSAAQLEALRSGVIPLRYLKNFQAIDLARQIRLCSGKVFICGCGGLGGVLINLLARIGVGYLRFADGDVFAPSNLNRQWFCDVQHLSMPKAQVAAEGVQAINPLIEAEPFIGLVSEENVDELLEGMDLALDALDNLQGRFVLAQAARRRGIPFIHAAVAGWWGQLSTFLPESSLDLQNIYGNKRSRDAAEDAMGVLGPTAAVIGSMEAMEAIRILSGGKPAYADQLLYYDGETGRLEILPL